MDVLGWALFALASGCALAIVAYLYHRREAPGRGRTLLTALRWAALSVLILLLFDPEIPTRGIAAGADATRVLLDASLSMTLPTAPDAAESRWARAVEQARSLAGGTNVITFDDGARAVSADELAELAPNATATRLLPALRAASESGARRAIVLTDAEIEDAAAVRRALPELGMEVAVRSVVDGESGNFALAELDSPGWAEADEPFQIRVGITAGGPVPERTRVVVRRSDEIVAEAEIQRPSSGRVATAVLEITPAEEQAGELIRYDVELAGSDAAPDDDRRSAYVFIGEEPDGVTLVSFRPDWEPRFLIPALEEAVGMPVRGFLAVGGDRFSRMGTGAVAGSLAEAADVRDRAENADLVVLHGLDDDAPEWARRLAVEGARVLVLPSAEAGEIDGPVELSAPAGGEWYATEDLPSSPVASLLTGIQVETLPPLRRIRSADSAPGAWTPLILRRNRRGVAAPLLLAGEREDRRWAVGLADGYWRWAFRGGEARRAYRRLWSAMAGWLIADRQSIAGDAVRPVQRIAERGVPLRWVAPGLSADSVAFELRGRDGEAPLALDTVVAMNGDTAATAALPPGHYDYRARAFAAGEEIGSATGPLTVASYSPEFGRRAAAVASLQGGEADRSIAAGVAARAPLHATVWPYLLLLLLLCSEWALRRRWGLR